MHRNGIEPCETPLGKCRVQWHFFIDGVPKVACAVDRTYNVASGCCFCVKAFGSVCVRLVNSAVVEC